MKKIVIYLSLLFCAANILAQTANTGNNVTTNKNTDSIAGFVFVEGGTYICGNCKVTLSNFYINRYLVTQKEWNELMGDNPSTFKGCDDCPVEGVSWLDVQRYISKLNEKTGKNFRLPTEVEWEYAAKGGKYSKNFIYPGSNSIFEVAWFNENSKSRTHPVGKKKPNELGLYDMSGNVWEWCFDWYDDAYWASGDKTNPTGPTSGVGRVLRGGSGGTDADDCTSTMRGKFNPSARSNRVGFRLVVVL